MLSVDLGLGPALVDWYRDATPGSFDELLFDLSPRTDIYRSYCANSAFIPSKFYVAETLKHLKHLEDEQTESLYSPSVPTFFPHRQNWFSKSLSKKIYPVSQ